MLILTTVDSASGDITCLQLFFTFSTEWEFKENGECKGTVNLPEPPITEPTTEAPAPKPVPCPTDPYPA